MYVRCHVPYSGCHGHAAERRYYIGANDVTELHRQTTRTKISKLTQGGVRVVELRRCAAGL